MARSILRRSYLAALAAASLAALLWPVVTATGRGAAPSADGADSRAPALPLDHYACYPGTFSTFQRRRVRLSDQFGEETVVVVRPVSLCAPADKNGQGVRDRRAHLTCYEIKPLRPFAPRAVTVKNQLGRQAMTVVRPASLCVPASKSRRSVPGKPPTSLDHFTCYAVDPRGQVRRRTVVLADQFGKAKAAVVVLLSLCAPTSKEGAPVRQPRVHLACYRIESEPVTGGKVLARNQFGLMKAALGRREQLCVPSEKSARPDLTVAIVKTAPIKVSCPGGQGTCVTTVDYVVSNVGAVSVTSSFDVLVQADPGLAVSATVTVPGLAAGASASLSTPLPAGGNCYDPDCTAQVTADSSNVVAESNEGNNIDTWTVPG